MSSGLQILASKTSGDEQSPFVLGIAVFVKILDELACRTMIQQSLRDGDEFFPIVPLADRAGRDVEFR